MEKINDLKTKSMNLCSVQPVYQSNRIEVIDKQDYRSANKARKSKLTDEILRRYLDHKLESGELIPIAVHNTYTANREKICEEIFQKFGVYIEERNRFYKGWFIEKIKEILKAQLIKSGLSKPSLSERREFRKKREAAAIHVENLSGWLQDLKATKRKLKTQVLGGVDCVWVSEETGIPFPHFINKRGKCCEILNNASRHIGFEDVREKAQSLSINLFTVNRPTYQKLLVFGTELRKEELKNSKNSEAQKNNTRHNLLKFLSIKCLNPEEEIGAEFGVLFEITIREVKEAIQNAGTRKKFSTEINRWQGYYNQLLKVEFLPENFADALKCLIEASGLTYSQIEKRLSFDRISNKSMLFKWANAITSPSVVSISKIHELEEFFGLPNDTLCAKITSFNKKGVLKIIKNFEATKNCSDHFLRKLRRLLPDQFFYWDRGKQEEAVKMLVESKQMNTNEYREKLKTCQQNPYRLTPRNFPNQLIEEIAEFNEYKTAVYVPEPYIRGNKSRWRNSSGRNGSLNIFTDSVASVLGALIQPIEKGGVALKIERLTLTLLILPKAWRIYIKFMENRVGAPSSRLMQMNLHRLIRLIDPEEGWLTQNPSFADKLEVLDGILSKEDVKEAKSDWRGFLDRIRKELKKILQYVDQEIEDSLLSRDSHIPILPILLHDKPWLLLLNALKAYEADIPDKLTAPFQYAVKIRNIVLLRILIETALRKGNLMDLTWNFNNTEQLQKKPDGNYRLVIPHRLFKNPHSSFFGQRGRKQPYICDLSGDLTPFMNIYLEECRPLLIDRWKQYNEGTDSVTGENFLFVYCESKPKKAKNKVGLKMSLNSADEVMTDFTTRHLVYNPVTNTGILGVQTFQMHAVRHIVATHILKKTRSYEKAAMAIQDTPQMVKKYYGLYLPEEEIKGTRSYLQDVIDESNNGFEN